MSKKKNRPYKYNAKSRLTPNSQSFPFKVNSIKKDVVTNLENTLTKLRVIDDSQEKTETLDDGFLGGRVEHKEEKKKQKKKEVSLQQREKVVHVLAALKKVVLTISFIGTIIVIIMLGYHFGGQVVSYFHQTTKNRVATSSKKASSIDDNYVFVGDFHTRNFAFEDYAFDYHYVKEANDHLTTSELLDHMKNMIYDYNPSIIFIEVGMMDLDNGLSQEEFVENYGKILDQITMHRPHANVYIESIYPINPALNDSDIIQDTMTNKMIKNYNLALKSLAIDKNVQYLDLYAKLSKKDTLDPQYTDDGVSLNSRGYQVVYKEIKDVIGN